MTLRLFYSMLFSLCVISCNQKSIDLPKFDESAWQIDKDGCSGTRLKMRNDLIKIKPQLKGLNNSQIISILGKPNKTNLIDRNQKYFIYNISCPSETGELSSLSVRFNAVGRSYEILVY